jgi:cytochrome c553
MKLSEMIAWPSRVLSGAATKNISTVRAFALAVLCGCCFIAVCDSHSRAELAGAAGMSVKPLEWAYGTGPAEALKPAPARSPAEKNAVDNELQHLPGSTFAFSRKQANDPFNPADWYPTDHPAMPDIVAHGRKSAGIWACDLCHFPNGKGKPENAAVSGLPVSYFIHQMKDFRNGLRRSADPGKQNTNLMIAYARAMTDKEIEQAAKYFGAMQWSSGANPWIKVIETEKVPKTRLSSGLYIPIEGAGTEPLGERLIEVPE